MAAAFPINVKLSIEHLPQMGECLILRFEDKSVSDNLRSKLNNYKVTYIKNSEGYLNIIFYFNDTGESIKYDFKHTIENYPKLELLYNGLVRLFAVIDLDTTLQSVYNHVLPIE